MLIGNLAEVSPFELIQTLHLNQKTGTLTCTRGDEIAILVLKEGELMTATFGPVQDEAAVYEMLRMTGGRFRFLPELPDTLSSAGPIGNITKILLHAGKTKPGPKKA